MNYKGSVSRFWIVLVIVLAGIYLINCFTPLRVTNDTARYFRLMEIEQGTWPSGPGEKDEYLSYGYVYLLLGLSKLNILNSFAICFINLLYLFGSLNYIRKIFSPQVSTAPLIIFTLLSWAMIQYTLMPLSEMQFLFFTAGSLFYFYQFNLTKKFTYLPVTLIFCFLAVLTRPAGIILPLALAVDFLYKAKSKKVNLVATGIVVAGIVIFFMQPNTIEYLGYFNKHLKRGLPSFFGNNIKMHLQDFAEPFINFPRFKTKFLTYTQYVYMLAGVFFLAYTLRRLFSKRFMIPLHIRAFMLGYILLIFNWPYYDYRFWVPIFPLLVAVLLLPADSPGRPFFSRTAACYKAYFVFTGLLALGYQTWLSFDKRALAIQQDGGKMRQEYRMHFFGEQAADSTCDKRVIYILDKYN